MPATKKKVAAKAVRSDKVTPIGDARKVALRSAYLNALFSHIRRNPGEKVPIYLLLTPEMKSLGIDKKWVDATLAKYKVLNKREFSPAE